MIEFEYLLTLAAGNGVLGVLSDSLVREDKFAHQRLRHINRPQA